MDFVLSLARPFTHERAQANFAMADTAALDVATPRTGVHRSGLAAASYTDTNLTGVVWRAVHIEELRSALTPARAQLALPVVSYTDPGSLVGLYFKAAHITDLRGGVQ